MSVVYKQEVVAGVPSVKDIIDIIYPIGSVFVSTSPTLPDSFSGTTWTKLATGTTLWNTDEGGGTTIAPSLPKLYGERNAETTDNNNSWSVNGVFSSTYKQDTQGATGTGGVRAKVIFDSSKGNSIYSGTGDLASVVRPNSIAVCMWKRVS